MKSPSTDQANVYTRRLRAKLSFLTAIAAQVGPGRALLVSLQLVRAKGINLIWGVLERLLPHRVECPICGWTGLRFRTAFFGSYFRDDCACPRCIGMERHRAYALYYSGLQLAKEQVVLYLAPERSLSRRLKHLTRRVIAADLFARNVQVQADLMHLPFKTASLDIIIHHHVLEHVPDDMAALAELERALKPGGSMFLSVPVNEARPATWDWGFPDPLKQDHYRDYGADFPQRLSRFDHAAINIPSSLSEDAARRHGLSAGETLYVCRKQEPKPAEALLEVRPC
jgi:SAM-dependent methyltransferase